MTALLLLLSCTPEPPPPPPAEAVDADHGGHWTRLDNLNFGHVGLVLGAMGDQVLIYGGYSPKAERLDLPSGKVLTSEPAPLALRNASAVSTDQGVLILGGRLPDDSLSDQILIWRPEGWSQGPTLQEAREGASATVFASGALICGGEGSAGPLSSCEVTTAQGSTPGPALKAPRSHAQMRTLEGAPVLVGGQGQDAEEILILDGESWRSFATLAQPRWGHAVVVSEGQIWVLGGRDESGALATVEVCTAQGCTPGPTLNEARAGLNAVLVGGGEMAPAPGGAQRIAVFGGLSVPDSPDALSSRTVELLVPGGTNWELGTRTGQARQGALSFSPGDGTVVLVGGDNRGKLATAVSRYSPLDKPPRVKEPVEAPEGPREQDAGSQAEGHTPAAEGPAPEVPDAD